MTREEQIGNQASQELGDHCWAFIRGAEWADANPVDPLYTAKLRNKVIENLELKLDIALAALTKLDGHYGKGSFVQDTIFHALNLIGKVK